MNQLTIKEASDLIDGGALIIDTRPSAEFVLGFIPGSIHMPLSEHFKEYAELVLDPEYNAIVIAVAGQEEKVCRDLLKTGLVNVAGYLEGGYETWAATGATPDLVIDIDAEEFAIDYKFDEFYLIDTRADDQYEAEHLEYAETMPLSEIEEEIGGLNTESTYYIYGASFEDAAFAASIFKRNDFHKLRVVSIGYESLKEVEIPVVKKKKEKESDSKFSDN